MRLFEKLQQNILAIVEIWKRLTQVVELFQGRAVQSDMNDVVHDSDP